MFAAEIEPAQSDGRRRSPRAPVAFDARIARGAYARALCKVTDISVHGARLQTYSALKKGSTIWLTLPTVGLVAANVMWADDFVAGCQFQAPLDPAAFATLVAHDTQPVG